MGAPDTPPQGDGIRASLALAAVVMLSVACSAQPPPRTSGAGTDDETTAEEAIASTIEASTESESSPEPTASEGSVAPSDAKSTDGRDRRDPGSAETEARRGSETIVLERGGQRSGDARNLVKASRAERERRSTAGPASVVIDDRNLSDHATGKLTFSDTAAEAEPDGVEPEKPEPGARGEEYWRQGAHSLREAWSDEVAAIELWEERAAELRVRFYSTDDPYVRDGKIKPQWDRSLDRLAAAQEEARRTEQALREFVEEGRRAGALPGWLREGVELEPDHFPYEGHQEGDVLSREHEVLDPGELREARSTDPEER